MRRVYVYPLALAVPFLAVGLTGLLLIVSLGWLHLATSGILLFSAALVITLTLSAVLYFTVTRPVRILTDALRAMTQGELTRRVAFRGSGCVVDMSEALNDMAARTQRVVDDLQRSERNYRTLIENLPQRMFLKDTESRYLSCNRLYADDLGVDQKAIAGMTDFDFYPEEIAKKYRADDRRILTLGETEEIEEAYPVGDERRYVRTVKSPIRNDDGELIGILGIFSDITKRRQARMVLERTRSRLLDAQEVAQLGVWEMDIGSNEALWSTQMFKLLGVDAGVTPGPETLLQQVFEADRRHVRRVLRAAMAGKRDFELEYRVRVDGRVRRVYSRARLERDELGRPKRLLGVVQDITERWQAEEAMRLAATAFETHEGILITDRCGTIVRVNRAFSDITGYTATEVLGANPRMLQSGRHQPAFYQALWKGLKERGRWEGEMWNKRKNGEVYPLYETISAVRDAAGEVTHYVGVFFDLTVIKTHQQQIERTAAEEHALGELLRLSLESLHMDAFLERALSLLLDSVPWMRLLPCGGVYLAEDGGERSMLRLTASKGVDADHAAVRQRVPFGQRCCGRAAESREIAFCSERDDPLAPSGDNSGEPAQCCVPLVSRDRTLGVLALYLPPGFVPEKAEKAFLCRVSDALSAGIIRRRMEAEAEFQAFHDPLTGLPNRRLLIDRLRRDIAVNHRRGTHGAVVLIDLDNFKKVNEALGHPVGDTLLERIAVRLSKLVRTEDTVARLGGDEFAVLLPQLAADHERAGYEAHAVAEKLRDTVAKPCYVDGREYQLTPSAGIVLFPSNGNNADELLRFADNAMYRAKESGRNAIRFFLPGMQHAADNRLKMENDLRHAVDRGEMCLHFQPQVNADGEVVGAEALLRWTHSKQGVIPPVDFIGLAEDAGLIVPLGEWVLHRACAMLKSWEGDSRFDRVKWLAVNVSPRQFRQADFIERVQRILDETGADPGRLELELTEGVLVENIQEAVDKIDALRAMGIGFAIDDFGTGYSSLIYLKKLPLNKLKIDRSFVSDLETDPNDAAIVETIVVMARHLKLQVIAEGVESPAQLDSLVSMGCEIYQGFHFAEPMDETDFRRFCRRKPQADSAVSAAK